MKKERQKAIILLKYAIWNIEQYENPKRDGDIKYQLEHAKNHIKEAMEEIENEKP